MSVARSGTHGVSRPCYPVLSGSARHAALKIKAAATPLPTTGAINGHAPAISESAR